MLKIRGLNTYYGNIQALDQVSLTVPEGKVVSIIGANGAGKSTLLKSISGLIRNKNGGIIYKEKDIIQLPAEQIVSRGISLVPEGRQLFAHMTVEDNIRLGAYHYYFGRHRRIIAERIAEVFEMFPILEKRAKQISGTLSGGEQQMLAIGRAFMARPEMILLDEPSMGIAPLIVREIFKVISRLNGAGTTVLLVEQNAKAALNVAHYAYVLESGRVVLEGLPQELLGNPKVKEVYLGG